MKVYILYSEKLDRYYIGQTDRSVEERLVDHNSKRKEGSFTSRGIPWITYLELNCISTTQALKVERHIKRMKSRQYIKNLVKYPAMQEQLLAKYVSVPDS